MDLFRKQLTRWTLNGKRVLPGTAGAIRISSESKKWYCTVKGRQVPLSADKTCAQKMAKKLAGDAELRSVGLNDPFETYRDMPINEHLNEYQVILEGKGNSAGHVRHVIQRIRAIIKGCGFQVIRDIDQGKVSNWLSEQRKAKQMLELPHGDKFTPKQAAGIFNLSLTGLSTLVKRHSLVATGNGKARRLPRATLEAIAERMAQGMSPETANHYVRAIRGFTNWLERSDRIRRNPLKGLGLFNAQVDIRHARRELTQDELQRLFEATRQSKRIYRGLKGEDRACLYFAATVTGFRARALANLKPSDFDLRNDMPMVTLAARFNKSKKPKVQPLPVEAAVLLARYLHHKPVNEPVWGDGWQNRGADMIRMDLADVGIPYVVEGTHGPQFADFHALRHSYLTLLGRSGVDLRTAQILAGHSTPTLTARYTHRGMGELSGAVAKLPMLTKQEAWTFLEPRKTGNDRNGCTKVAQLSGHLRHSGALTDTQPVLEAGK